MKLTADDYRESYRALGDDEFLAIDRDELVDVARRVYDAELKRRQLEPPLPVEDVDEVLTAQVLPIPEDEDLVQVALVTQAQRAISAQRLLMEADIPCELNHQPTLPGTYAEGTIGLMVPVSCVVPAQELLAHIVTGDNQLLARRWLEQEWTPDGLELRDFLVTVDDMFGDADKVAARFTAHGVDPSGGKVQMDGLAIIRMDAGQIAEHWVKL